MKRACLALLAFCLLSPLSAHAAGAPTSPDPTAQARKDVEAAVQSYAAAIRNGGALADLFSEDGELINPGLDPLVGPEAIRAFLAPLLKQVRIEEAAMTSRAIELYGDEAFVWGDYSQKVAVGERPLSTFAGRFVAQWHRADGRWKVRRMMVQPAPAAAP